MTTHTETKPPSDRALHLAEIAMRWSGWGSPVGVSFLIASIGLFLMCLHWSGLLGMR